MKRKHCLLPLLLLLPLLIAPSAKATVAETDTGIFYSVSDGVVTVEGFNAAGTVMDVPATIGGMPVRYIADQACRNDPHITEVRLPEGLMAVGEFAFSDCPNLTKVTFKGGETIGFSAFRGCRALLSLTLPDTLKSLDDYAFYGCTMLGKVKIPASVTVIGVDTFMGCDRLMLDVRDNPYAKAHAEQYNIPTSFTDTSAFTFLLLAVTTLLLGGSTWAIYRVIHRHKAKP